MRRVFKGECRIPKSLEKNKVTPRGFSLPTASQRSIGSLFKFLVNMSCSSPKLLCWQVKNLAENRQDNAGELFSAFLFYHDSTVTTQMHCHTELECQSRHWAICHSTSTGGGGVVTVFEILSLSLSTSFCHNSFLMLQEPHPQSK